MAAKLLKLKKSMGLSPNHDDFDDDDYTSDEMNGTDDMQSDPEYEDDDESRTGNRTPITSSALSFVADQDYRDHSPQHHTTVPSSIRTVSNSSSGCSPASSMSPASYIEDDKENDLETISNDFNTADHFQWENLLSEPTIAFKSNDLCTLNIPDLRDIDDSEILSTNSSNTVKIEHNYFNNPITNNNVKVAEKNDAASAPGVCLHVSQGRVSLEFCATCHLNSQNAWCEEM